MGSRNAGNSAAASNMTEMVLVDPVSGLPYAGALAAASASLNLSAATLVKAEAGRLARISVTVIGSSTGSVNDAATIVGAATANLIGTIPNTLGMTVFDWPFAAGLVITPGAGGQVVAVTYS